MATNGNVPYLNANGQTESDATHPRFRQKRPEEKVTCLSCGQNFPITSNMDIVQHYTEIHHQDYYGSCLYCKGKVHRYTNSRDSVQVYHDCSRSKRGIEK